MADTRRTSGVIVAVAVLVAVAACGPRQPADIAPATAAGSQGSQTDPGVEDQHGGDPGRPVEEEEGPQQEAERQARAAFFAFELTDVDQDFGGDWAAFLEHKRGEERALAETWAQIPDRANVLHSAEDARGHRVLQLEFERVVRQQAATARQEAARVIAALAAGDVAAVAHDCYYYGAEQSDRVSLCEQMLRELPASVQGAVASVGTDFEPRVLLDNPSPARGMQASARIPFGPEATAPAGAGRSELYPATHEIWLSWSGPVMPDANGPVHAAPQEGVPAEGRWRFTRLALPYSVRPTRLR